MPFFTDNSWPTGLLKIFREVYRPLKNWYYGPTTRQLLLWRFFHFLRCAAASSRQCHEGINWSYGLFDHIRYSSSPSFNFQSKRQQLGKQPSSWCRSKWSYSVTAFFPASEGWACSALQSAFIVLPGAITPPYQARLHCSVRILGRFTEWRKLFVDIAAANGRCHIVAGSLLNFMVFP